MKKFLPSIILLLCCVMGAYAQAPKGINYQGVARDNEGKAYASKKISVRISILKNAANGEVEYAETHAPTTNQFGLFTLVVGQGTKITGDFGFISWAVGTKWLQVEIDPNGGSSFALAGSQQLMTVPYAFYAESAGNSNSLTAGNGIAINNNVISNAGDSDNDPTNELQTLNGVLTQSNNAGGLKITNLGAPLLNNDAATKSYVDTQISNDLDKDPTNELQDLSQVLTRGSDAGGNKITNLGLPTANTDAATKSYVDSQNALDLDQSATNEIQDLTLNTTTDILRITNNASATNIDLTPYQQTLTYTPATNNLSISNGNNVTISTTLSQVITNGGATGANGARIQNVGAPTLGTDATTKNYVDNAIATNYAFKTNFSFTNGTAGFLIDQEIIFTSEDFDLFNVLGSNTFTATENGVYVFMVDGTYTKAGTINVGQLSLLLNTTKYGIPLVLPFLTNTPRFNATFMFRLNAGQTVKLIGDIVDSGATFSGAFYGYKL